MMTTADEIRLTEIDVQLAELKEALPLVRGRDTEVYTRIVGYYRAIKNWNLGKQAEFSHRTPFNWPEKIK